MAIVSTLDGVAVRVSGEVSSGGTTVTKTTNMGTLNPTRYDDTKMNAIITALVPVISFDITKKTKTQEFFLTKSE